MFNSESEAIESLFTQDWQHKPITLDLRQVAPSETVLVGGKAKSLGILMSLRFDVPEGFVVTTEAFRRFLDGNGLEASSGSHPATDQAVGTRICYAITHTEFPAELLLELRDRYRQTFGEDKVALAVRSSGVSEDSVTASYAGQFESVLNVVGFDAVLAAIRRCWNSQFQPSAIAYRKASGGENIDQIAVIIQRLVDPDVAGVLFTVNPLTGDENEHVVEAVFGLGEILVSGAANGDRYILEAASGALLSSTLADKRLRTVLASDNGVRRVTVVGAAATKATLTTAELERLAAAGRLVQEHYGRPMDIEWAFAGEKLYLVQARPITAIQFAAEIGAWTTADFRDGGVSSSVCCAFMWSLYQRAFQSALPQFMAKIRIRSNADAIEWIRQFFGRPYWNLGEVKNTLARLPGYREREFDEDLGIPSNYEGPGVCTPVSALALARAFVVLMSVPICQRRRLARNQRFAAEFEQRQLRFPADPASLAAYDDMAFAKAYHELCDLQFETETAYFETIFSTSIAKIAFVGAVKAVERKTGLALDPRNLLGGLLDLSHSRPWKDLYELAASPENSARLHSDEFVMEFASRWPQHGRKELDITTPRWPDDPSFVRALVNGALQDFERGHDPFAAEYAQHQRFVDERQRALAAIGSWPILRRRFTSSLARMRDLGWWREEMRDYSSRMYALVRLWSLEAGRRLRTRGYLNEDVEIWALGYESILSALRGSVDRAQIRAKVLDGLRMSASFRNFEPANEIGERNATDSTAAFNDARSTRLYGIPCSTGRAEGRVRIVSDPECAHGVEEGDILVTKFTDPGWTLLFPRLAGVITETGGILSHAAVISREFGIPAVLGVAGATSRIQDGCRAALDGARGTIDLLS